MVTPGSHNSADIRYQYSWFRITAQTRAHIFRQGGWGQKAVTNLGNGMPS